MRTKSADHYLRVEDGMRILRGLTLSGDYLYAVSAIDKYIYKLSPSLAVLARFGGPSAAGSEATGAGTFATPEDIAADDRGDLYITDSASNLVQFFHYYGGAG